MKLHLLLKTLLSCLLAFQLVAKTDTNTVNTLNDRALDLAYSDPGKAMELAEKALQTARQLHFAPGEIRALIRKGIIYDVQSKNKEAIAMYEESLALSKKNDYKKGIASNLNNLGLIYWKMSELEKATSHFNRAYERFNVLEDEYNMASAANNLGLISEELSRPRKSISWYNKALEHCRNAGEKDMVYDIYSNIAMAYETLDKFDSAQFYDVMAIEGYRKNGNRYGLGMTLSNLGIVLNSKKRFREAIPYFEEAMQIAEEIGNKYSYASSGYNLASSYYFLGQYAQQREALEKVYPAIMELEGNELGYKVCLDLARCYYREGKFREGERLMRRHNELRHKYEQELINKNIAEAEKKFENRDERRRNKLKQQRTQLRLEQQEAGRFMDNVIWTAIFTVIFLGSLLVFFIVRKRNLQKELVSQKAVFDATMEERKRISYDLHDHVGSQFSYVVNNLELIQHLDSSNERIQRTFSMSQAAMSSLRDTVWALHSEELTLASLTERMENVARKTLESTEGLQPFFDFRVDEQTIVPQQTTMHVMRIFQEAVHNVVKHAQATQLSVTATETVHEVRLTVSDNGTGIAEDPHKPFHYGLQSMRERAEKIGGKLSVSAGESGGTTVELTWPKSA